MAGFKALCKLSFHPPGGYCSLEEPSANSGNGASSEGPLSSWDEPVASPLGRPHQEGYLHHFSLLGSWWGIRTFLQKRGSGRYKVTCDKAGSVLVL